MLPLFSITERRCGTMCDGGEFMNFVTDSGKYTNLKQITEPHAENYENRFHTFIANEAVYDAENEQYDIDENIDGTIDYSISNPDFNFSEFRSNLVIRWEYSPGFTVYLVWSQGRTNSDSHGRFAYGDDMSDLFNVQAHNVFLIKFNYWISL